MKELGKFLAVTSKCYICNDLKYECNHTNFWLQKLSKNIYIRSLKDNSLSMDYAFEALVPANVRASNEVNNWFIEISKYWCNSNALVMHKLLKRKYLEYVAYRFLNLSFVLLMIGLTIYQIADKHIGRSEGLILLFLLTLGSSLVIHFRNRALKIVRFDSRLKNIDFFSDSKLKEQFQDENFIYGNTTQYSEGRFFENLKKIEANPMELDVIKQLYNDGYNGEIKDLLEISKLL